MWLEKTIDLGEIEEKTEHKLEYKYTGEKPLKVVKIKTSCGCTKGKYNEETGILTATYKAETVPIHLKYKGEFVINKRIWVETNRGPEELNFKATIKSKENDTNT